MKRLRSSNFWLGILLAIVSGCSPVLYSTTGQNVPLFREKGEVALNASYATTDDGYGGGFQFATAVNNNWALLTSFYSLSSNSTADWKGNGKYFEAGGGYYGTLDAKKKFIYETFLGIGFGGINNTFENSRVDVKFVKPFFQPSIGFSGKWFDAALTPRFALVSYTGQSVNLEDPDQQDEADRYFSEKKNTFVFEPGFTIRGGYKNIKLQLQYNLSTMSYKTSTTNQSVNINNNFFSLGLNYLITKRYRN